MTFISKPLLIPAVLAALTAPAYASTQKCTPAEDLVVAMTTLSKLPADMTDTLTMTMVLHITKEDGSPLGERVFYRAPDGGETDLPVDADNKMTGAQDLAGADARGELCRANTAGGDTDEKSTVSANMAFTYNDAGGVHSAGSVIEGAKDGRGQLKALAPAAVRLMVPKLKYVVASKVDKDGPDLTVTALRGAAAADGVALEYFQGMPAFSVAGLKKSKADSIRITGGAYKLLAMPKPAKGDLSDTPQTPAAQVE